MNATTSGIFNTVQITIL